MYVWELVTDVLLLKPVWAWTCFIMNCVICGSGTILMSILGDANINKTQFVIGVLQFLCFLTGIILLGIFGTAKVGGIAWLIWMWSVYWGYLIVSKTFTASAE